MQEALTSIHVNTFSPVGLTQHWQVGKSHDYAVLRGLSGAWQGNMGWRPARGGENGMRVLVIARGPPVTVESLVFLDLHPSTDFLSQLHPAIRVRSFVLLRPGPRG